MKIVVDQNIAAAQRIFDSHAEVVALDGRTLRRQDLQGVDALIIRSVTQVGENLLAGTGVGFVGTTTIGVDHLDIPWLEKQGIRWVNAPGCNADSAAQYSLAMISVACDRLGRRLKDQTVGIIGRGNVGSRVQRLLEFLGVSVLAHDPPLADLGEAGLVSLDQALDQDIICLHVPLTHDGNYPTFRLVNQCRLAAIRPGALLLNSARGDVVDGEALKNHLTRGVLHAALDVWPGEPDIDGELLQATTVATPHVAGYSDDGKRNGAMMVYRAFCKWAGFIPSSASSEPDPGRELSIASGESAVETALEAACFVRTHDRAMRELAGLSPDRIAVEFDRLRREYPQRRDFRAWRVFCEDEEASALLARLGFSMAGQV
jgi:erythronate-4-phosphate dehydrogenase